MLVSAVAPDVRLVLTLLVLRLTVLVLVLGAIRHVRSSWLVVGTRVGARHVGILSHIVCSRVLSTPNVLTRVRVARRVDRSQLVIPVDFVRQWSALLIPQLRLFLLSHCCFLLSKIGKRCNFHGVGSAILKRSRVRFGCPPVVFVSVAMDFRVRIPLVAIRSQLPVIGLLTLRSPSFSAHRLKVRLTQNALYNQSSLWLVSHLLVYLPKSER